MKIVLALVLALVLVLSLAACGGDTADVSSNTETTKKESNTADYSSQESKIDSYQAENLAKQRFLSLMGTNLKKKLIHGGCNASINDTFENIQIGSTSSKDITFAEEYEVVINGSCSIYDEYGMFKSTERFSVEYTVTYSGSVF